MDVCLPSSHETNFTFAHAFTSAHRRHTPRLLLLLLTFFTFRLGNGSSTHRASWLSHDFLSSSLRSPAVFGSVFFRQTCVWLGWLILSPRLSWASLYKAGLMAQSSQGNNPCICRLPCEPLFNLLSRNHYSESGKPLICLVRRHLLFFHFTHRRDN